MNSSRSVLPGGVRGEARQCHGSGVSTSLIKGGGLAPRRDPGQEVVPRRGSSSGLPTIRLVLIEGTAKEFDMGADRGAAPIPPRSKGKAFGVSVLVFSGDINPKEEERKAATRRRDGRKKQKRTLLQLLLGGGEGL